MRKLLIGLATTAAAIATPAAANEGRIEPRGGIIWSGGDSEATAGMAIGYDFDSGNSMFFGVEASADKVLTDGTSIYWGLTGRVGTNVSDRGKLFAAGGYTFGEGDDAFHLGAGYEHEIVERAAVKIEYRHYFSDAALDADAVALGLVVKF